MTNVYQRVEYSVVCVTRFLCLLHFNFKFQTIVNKLLHAIERDHTICKIGQLTFTIKVIFNVYFHKIALMESKSVLYILWSQINIHILIAIKFVLNSTIEESLYCIDSFQYYISYHIWSINQALSGNIIWCSHPLHYHSHLGSPSPHAKLISGRCKCTHDQPPPPLTPPPTSHYRR